MPACDPAMALPIHIGAYRIERPLGRGGMGEVFLAWDDRLERHVAIKRIRGDKPIDPRRRARFRREARATARLSHPAIVQIFDIVSTGDGECLVMEYVDGQGLDQVLAGRGLPLSSALKLAAEIAEALAQAHAKGLIHRDLKPQNVIVTPSEHVKLLDFGLARMLGPANPTDVRAAAGEDGDSLTESGALVGTISAMSPEQARGHAVDHRSDLFALGSLLYQMVTGQAPFSGKNLLDTLYKVTSYEPPPVAGLRPELPVELSTLIGALLAKEPSARPQSARLVTAELEHIARLVNERPAQPSGSEQTAPASNQDDIANQSTASQVLVRALAPLPALTGRLGSEPAPPVPVVRVLVMTELTGTEGARHPQAARDALARFGGLEAEGSERGFLWIFERPIDALCFALAYHEAVAQLARELKAELTARVAVHLGEVALRPSASQHATLTVSGPPRVACARILALALPRQTLLTRGTFDLARQPTARGPLADPAVRWLAHGAYSVPEVEQPIELFEVGGHGAAPLREPPDTEHGKRIVPTHEEPTLGWRPAAGQAIPQRPNWILRERIGQGGFGEVWLALHPSGELRVFKFCFEAARLRVLKREITLVRLLESALGQRHDIARILDWDVSSAPYFIESEYTDGGDLVDWSDEQGGIAEVPLETRLVLAAEVAGALAAAHSVGVLHKDVKPQNVLVTRDRDGHPRARLADFGVGMVLDRELLGEHGLSRLGFTGTLATADVASAGTLGYLAPELVEGKPATIQADLYALGVMLYQMVAGDFSRTLAPGWQRDIEDELLAQDIASLVDRAPERRPASAAEVAEKLRTLEARRAERAQAEQARRVADEAKREIERAQRRRRVAALAAALTSLMLVVVSAFAYQAREARKHAELRRAQAEGLIDFMLGDLRGKLQPMGKLAILDDIGKRALDYFAAVPEGELSSQELQSRAKALEQIGQVRVAQGKLADATAAFREALRLSKGLAERDPGSAEWQFDLGQSHFWVGYLLWQQKDLAGAMEQFRAYLAISEALVARDPRNRRWMLELAYAHSNIGSIARERGDNSSALTSLRASAGLMETLLAQAPDDDALRQELGHVHAKLGDLLARLGDLAGATGWLEKYRSAMQTLVERAPEDMERLRYLGYAHSHLGDVLRQRGDVDGALAHYRTDLAIAERLAAHDTDNRELALELSLRKNKVANILLLRRAFDEAHALYTAERSIIDALLAHDPGNREWRFALARSHWSLAQLLAAQGRAHQAVARAQEAVGIVRQLVAEAPDQRIFAIWLAYYWWLLGEMHERAGAPLDARAAWQQGLALGEALTRLGSEPLLCDVHVRLLLGLGRIDEARPLLAELDRMGYREPLLVELCRKHGVPLGAHASVPMKP